MLIFLVTLKIILWQRISEEISLGNYYDLWTNSQSNAIDNQSNRHTSIDPPSCFPQSPTQKKNKIKKEICLHLHWVWKNRRSWNIRVILYVICLGLTMKITSTISLIDARKTFPGTGMDLVSRNPSWNQFLTLLCLTVFPVGMNSLYYCV